MHLYTKISWITMLLFFLILLAALVPSNLGIFLTTLCSGFMMIYLVISILKDNSENQGDYPVQ